MAQKVFIGKSYQEWGFLLGAIFFPAATIGTVVAIVGQAEEFFQVLLAITAAFFGALLMWRWTVISGNRRWISETPTGFLLTDKRGEYEFPDETIQDLATWMKVRYANGLPKANQSLGFFTVQMGELSTRFPLNYEFKLGAPDPLGTWIQRVFDSLVKRQSENIKAGGTLVGDGWVYDRVGLTLTTGKEDKVIPMEDVSVVEVVDAKVKVWVRNVEEAVVQVKAESPNALIMGRLLQDVVTARPAVDTMPATGLGRVIFERDHSIKKAGLVAGWFVALLLLIAAVVAFVGAIAGFVGESGYVIGPVCFMFFGLVAWTLFEFRVKVFRCQALGISYKKTRKTLEMKYQDIGAMTYSATRMYHNGAYIGTNLKMVFDPMPGTDAPSISYSASVKNADAELDNLQDFISKIIAGHMLKRLHAGKAVTWTPRVRFLPDGLEIKPIGWFKGNAEPQVVEYSKLGNSTFEGGVFYLSIMGHNKWAVKEATTQPNFFPGYALLGMILSPAPPQDVSAPEQDTNRDENPNQDTE